MASRQPAKVPPQKRYTSRVKIRTLIALSSGLLVVFTLAIAFIAVFATSVTNRMARQGAAAETLIAHAFEQNSLAQDYLTYREERPKRQWYLQYARLEELLASPVLQDAPSRSHVPALLSNATAMRNLFDALVVQAESAAPNAALEQQLSADLLVRSRAIIQSADSLAKETFAERSRTRSATDNAIFALLAVLAAVTLWIGLTLYRRIVGSIAELQKGVQIVGKGDLNHRVGHGDDCEIGQLSSAFDDMTAKLQRSYETLEEKVRERTRELEELSRKNEHLLQSIGDGVVAINRDWDIILWNGAAETITGWSAAEAMGRSLREVARFANAGDGKENIEFIERAMLFGEVRAMDGGVVMRTKDGRLVPVGDSAAPVYDRKTGKVSGAIIVFRDTSAEQALKDKDLQMAKLRNDFLFRTIHDLRSPATGIRLALDMHAEQEARMGAQPEDRKRFDMIRDASARMSKLIEDLLEIAKGEKAEVVLKKEALDARLLVEGVLGQSAPMMQVKGISASHAPADVPPRVVGDANALKEVFDNLINNAIKYNRPSGRITVSYRTEGGLVHVAVTDTGIGIAGDDVRKLFTPYFRAAADRDIQGTGLGLYIVKNLVEKMGGTVTASSIVGEGSQFTVSLPRA